MGTRPQKYFVERLTAVSHHRNGVGGKPFTVVLFDRTSEGPLDTETRMVAIIPVVTTLSPADRDAVECYVLSVERLHEGVVEFGVNSWRGDRFHDELTRMVVEWDSEPHEEKGADTTARDWGR